MPSSGHKPLYLASLIAPRNRLEFRWAFFVGAAIFASDDASPHWAVYLTILVILSQCFRDLFTIFSVSQLLFKSFIWAKSMACSILLSSSGWMLECDALIKSCQNCISATKLSRNLFICIDWMFSLTELTKTIEDSIDVSRQFVDSTRVWAPMWWNNLLGLFFIRWV